MREFNPMPVLPRNGKRVRICQYATVSDPPKDIKGDLMGRRQIKTHEPGDRPVSKGTGDATGGRIRIPMNSSAVRILVFLPVAFPEF